MPLANMAVKPTASPAREVRLVWRLTRAVSLTQRVTSSLVAPRTLRGDVLRRPTFTATKPTSVSDREPVRGPLRVPTRLLEGSRAMAKEKASESVPRALAAVEAICQPNLPGKPATALHVVAESLDQKEASPAVWPILFLQLNSTWEKARPITVTDVQPDGTAFVIPVKPVGAGFATMDRAFDTVVAVWASVTTADRSTKPTTAGEVLPRMAVSV